MVAQNRDTRRAAAAVELAMLLPILALLFAAVLDFARVFHATQVLQTAANDGAMYATGTAWVPASTTTPTDAAKAAAVAAGASLNPPLAVEQVAVTTAGNASTVTVTYDFPLFCGFLFPDGVQLQRTATVRTAPNPFE